MIFLYCLQATAAHKDSGEKNHETCALEFSPVFCLLKTVIINMTGHRKLCRGNRIKLLASEINFLDNSDGAQDLSGGRLLYAKQFHCMNLDCLCDLLDV